MRARAAAKPPSKRKFSGKYDDADWHYGGDFPPDLPNAAGATHIGLFVASCILQGLVGELHAEEIEALQSREITPGAWLVAACDKKFTDEDLNDEGNAFAMDYFYPEGAQYLADYEHAFGRGLKTLYHVQDTWESFDIIDKVIRERLTEWRKRNG